MLQTIVHTLDLAKKSKSNEVNQNSPNPRPTLEQLCLIKVKLPEIQEWSTLMMTKSHIEGDSSVHCSII